MNPKDLPACDLVMKGGLTSGVVYPALLSQLRQKYRFQCIGGTSAGAIAAALTAAAELGRNSGRGGFDELDKVAKELTQDNFLLDLFQPDEETKPLMDLALKFLKQKNNFLKWSARTALSYLVLCLGIAAIIVGILLWWIKLESLPEALVIGLLLLVGIAAPLACLLLFMWVRPLYHVVAHVLPQQGFGLCTGRRDSRLKEYAGKKVLTDWLSEKLKSCAGLEGLPRPLTFGDLWGTDKPEDPEKRIVDLHMFTSNVSQQQPYVFPLDREELFFFNEAEFLKYFEEEVVDHMIEHSNNGGWQVPKGYHLFPPAAHFPVIVATRISLSFPVLFKAVPVYTLPSDAQKSGPIEEKNLQKNWFSDGGICSNFPIHIFDAWLPPRPTFGVNLTSFAPESLTPNGQLKASAQVRQKQSCADLPQTRRDEPVFMPKADDPQSPDFKEIKGLLQFLSSVVGTAKDCHDQLQSMLPSYCERIVQIRLKNDEGGLNLAMPQTTIQAVIDKGKEAGRKLANDFDMKQHQWVRLRVLMSQIFLSLTDMQIVLGQGSFELDALFREQEAEKFPYTISGQEAAKFKKDVLEFKKLMDDWLKEAKIKADDIDADPTLRVVPPKL